MSWADQLANGIKQALKRKGTVRIAVYSDIQAELGKLAAKRMASCPEVAANLNFVVIPDHEQGKYPIGAILDP